MEMFESDKLFKKLVFTEHSEGLLNSGWSSVNSKIL